MTAYLLDCTCAATARPLRGFPLVVLLLEVTSRSENISPLIPGAGTGIGFSVLNQHSSPGAKRSAKISIRRIENMNPMK